MAEKAKRITPSYKPKDVESVINKEGWDLHFNQLYKGYVDKYNKGDHSTYITGGWKLHEAFFGQFKAASASTPSGAAKELIDRKFGSFKQFKDEFVKKAKEFHGSGWIYLSTTGKIELVKLHEPRTNVAMIVDLWEHSFVQTFESHKDAYFKGIWTIIDWDIVSDRIKPKENLNESASMRHLIDYINKG